MPESREGRSTLPAQQHFARGYARVAADAQRAAPRRGYALALGIVSESPSPRGHPCDGRDNVRIRLRCQGDLGIRDGDLRCPAWGGCAQQQQAQGGAPGDQDILAVGLGVDRGIPPPASAWRQPQRLRTMASSQGDKG